MLTKEQQEYVEHLMKYDVPPPNKEHSMHLASVSLQSVMDIVAKQARLSALQECREIAEKSQNKYLQVTQDEGIPVTEQNRQRSMMLAVKSVNDEIQSLIDKEGSKEE